MDDGMTLWERVCATVTRFGQPRRPSPAPRHDLTNEASSVLDLHGLTVHVAFARAKAFIADTPHAEVLVITGQGQISYEFPDWLIQWKRVRSWTAQRGNGAYRVRLR